MPLAARVLTTRPAADVAQQATTEAPPLSAQPTPDTPPPDLTPASNSRSKGGKPTHRKKGRNQYTKDRDGRDDESPVRSQSRDVQDHAPGGHTKTAGNESGKPSRPRGGMNSRVTMAEMKRRVTAMFDFISKTQLELAGESPPEPAHESRRSSRENGVTNSLLPLITVNGSGGSPKRPPGYQQQQGRPYQ